MRPIKEEITGRLENWYVSQVTEKELVVNGNIYNDIRNRWEDGTHIHTSGVKNSWFEEGDLIDTRNSIYLLGKKYKEE